MLDLFESGWEELWAGADTAESVGSVFTKPEIVSLILDVAGYCVGTERLAEKRVLEPSCGDGAFLARVVDRLVESERAQDGGFRWDDPVLDHSLRAADIDLRSLTTAREIIADRLERAGCPANRVRSLSGTWTVHTDFLLATWEGTFDLVVGNPPYVRIEALPKRVLLRYRQIFETTNERADLYVAFFEKGLQLLSPGGALAYICANRFAKNKYGQSLRRLIVRDYHVRYYVNLEHTQPFLTDVSAYPAIVVIDRSKGEPTRAATLDDLDEATLDSVRHEAAAGNSRQSPLSVFPSWYPNGGPWLTTRKDEHKWLGDLQEAHPLLEESAPGTRVGIGVATGADSVFVLAAENATIEKSRQLPLLMAGDISNQGIQWSGHYLLNPFADEDDGTLVDLRRFPGLAAYFERERSRLVHRHVAKARPASWYRTIDRIWPRLRAVPKLVLPDIQGRTTVGLDDGSYYPHHNVYFITSEAWHLRALKALLRSDMVRRQVSALSVQMRGGSLRFQSQTLRRVRVPSLSALPDSMIAHLAAVSDTENQAELDQVAAEAFAIHQPQFAPSRPLSSQQRVAERKTRYRPPPR